MCTANICITKIPFYRHVGIHDGILVDELQYVSSIRIPEASLKDLQYVIFGIDEKTCRVCIYRRDEMGENDQLYAVGDAKYIVEGNLVPVDGCVELFVVDTEFEKDNLTSVESFIHGSLHAEEVSEEFASFVYRELFEDVELNEEMTRRFAMLSTLNVESIPPPMIPIANYPLIELSHVTGDKAYKLFMLIKEGKQSVGLFHGDSKEPITTYCETVIDNFKNIGIQEVLYSRDTRCTVLPSGIEVCHPDVVQLVYINDLDTYQQLIQDLGRMVDTKLVTCIDRTNVNLAHEQVKEFLDRMSCDPITPKENETIVIKIPVYETYGVSALLAGIAMSIHNRFERDRK